MRDWYNEPELEAMTRPTGLSGLAARESAQVDLQQYATSLADSKRAQVPAPAPAPAAAPAPAPAPAPRAYALTVRDRGTLERAADVLSEAARVNGDALLEGMALRLRGMASAASAPPAPRKIGRPRGTYNAALEGAVSYAAACRKEGMSFEQVAAALVELGYENGRGQVSWSKQGVASLLKCRERGEL